MDSLLYASIAPEWVADCLTPIWIISLGVLAGLIVLAVFGLIVRLTGPMLGAPGKRAASELGIILTEGFLNPVSVIAGIFAAFALLGYFIADDPNDILRSLPRLGAIESVETTFTVPPATRDAQGEVILEEEEALPIGVRSEEIHRMTISSDQRVSISAMPASEDARITMEAIPDSDARWVRVRQVKAPFPDGMTEELYAVNFSEVPANVKIQLTVRPPIPEVSTIPVVALVVIAVYLLYFLHRVFMPRLAAVGLASFKSEVNTPLFLLLTCLGVFLLAIFIYIPYNTFGEDIKMLKDSGLTLILVLTIFQAVWSASTSVAEEIDGKTALTVLSKPIDRRSFLIGKFAGIAWTVCLMFLILSVVFLVVIAYKPIYDARENSDSAPAWQICHSEVVRTVPGLSLMLMETLLLTALSVALSTRLPLAPNMVVCFSIYVLGHLTPLLVQSSTEGFEVVRFFAQLLATAIPVLENFNIAPAIAAGRDVPLAYVGWASVYCFLFTCIALLLALLMFEDRDLA